MQYIVDNCDAKAARSRTRASREIAARGRVARARSSRRRLAVGGEIPGFAPLEDALADVARGRAARRRARGLGDALLVGHDRPAQGRAAARCRACPPGDPVGDAACVGLRDALRHQRERRLPVARAALPRRAARRSRSAQHRIGATAVVMRRFDAEDALRIDPGPEGHRRRSGCRRTSAGCCRCPRRCARRYDVSSLRVAIHAAAPCPIPLKEAMIDWWGDAIMEYYARHRGRRHADPRAGVARAQGLGRPALGGRHGAHPRRGRRRDRRSRTARARSTSRRRPIRRARFATTRTTRRPPATYRGNLFTIGDIGYLDADGYLYLTDRQSNMIISGGVNIYPQETESHLVMHPKVQDVAVIGVPNEEMGEEVKAVVVPAPGVAPGPDARARADRVLPRAHRPLQVSAHDRLRRSELPRTETGKMAKRAAARQVLGRALRAGWCRGEARHDHRQLPLALRAQGAGRPARQGHPVRDRPDHAVLRRRALLAALARCGAFRC